MASKITTVANGLYDALKHKESVRLSDVPGMSPDSELPMALDDTERVKVLSPGRMVLKRFFRNLLALVGLSVLIIMFAFSFIGPVFYPYSQTRIFYKYEGLNTNYASASLRTENVAYKIPDGPSLSNSITNRFNSYTIDLENSGLTEQTITGTDGGEYIIKKLGDKVYTLSVQNLIPIGSFQTNIQVAKYDRLINSYSWTGDNLPTGFIDTATREITGNSKEFMYRGVSYTIASTKRESIVTLTESLFTGAAPDAGFVSALTDIITDIKLANYNGHSYRISDSGDGVYKIDEITSVSDALIGSAFVFNARDVSTVFSDEFRINALYAIYGTGSFTADGASFSVVNNDDDLFITDATGSEIADLGAYSIRRYSGQDSLPIDFKEVTQRFLEDMTASGKTTGSFVYPIHEIDENGNYLFDDNGDPKLTDTVMNVERKPTGEYVLSCIQITYLIDINGPPTGQNRFGTDGDGMDILARMMYGGRISLMVGFIVVFFEIILGVILGGISGFFGGWVDTLIMRLVDVFYCIPSYPILIIMAAFFDVIKMDSYRRLMWMMVILGILGWASIARLVRGQILSFREQEFMIAQEATGMKARRRIFRHLIPNVMPQLIVTATMGVGDIIIYESTLSFLGLGVKHPLATWGTMINAVTGSTESMLKYAYMWVPIGLLICLTVIAFNFVGDGLRDAFDPKMKR